jgi:hypothetical protein
MNEVLKALAFCMIGMTISFYVILDKNHYTIQMNGHTVKLFGIKE